ncbi:MAG: lysozyme inhibitor LprI family protein [Hyphomicrobiaceae bacterium]
MSNYILAAPKGLLIAGFLFAAYATAADAHHLSGTYNPSFSCKYATKAAERAVCSSWRLSRLDRRLAYWYGKAMERAYYFDMTSEVRSEQRRWLHQRNACGGKRWCLARKYRQRIRSLRNWATHV